LAREKLAHNQNQQGIAKFLWKKYGLMRKQQRKPGMTPSQQRHDSELGREQGSEIGPKKQQRTRLLQHR
jgi:hypothetical protein